MRDLKILTRKLRRVFRPSHHDDPIVLQDRYRSAKIELLGELRAIARNNTLTLVFAARDELHNEAIVLRDVLTS